MEWRVEAENEFGSVEGVFFEPSDVYRLSRLGNDLPWLSGLDPYSDRQIRDDEIALARNDLEAALLRHCLEFAAQYASSKGSALEDLIGRPGLVSGVFAKLKTDTMYKLLRRAILLMDIAEKRNLTVNLYGT